MFSSVRQMYQFPPSIKEILLYGQKHCICDRCNITKTGLRKQAREWQQCWRHTLTANRVRVKTWEKPLKAVHESMKCVGWNYVCTAASHSAPNPPPLPTPQRKLVHHVGFEAAWRGRVCTTALLCLVLHNMSWGIDIPQPFLSPSLPPQQWSSPATACSLFRGSKKSSRRSKNSSACTALSGSCLLPCLPQHLNTNKIPHHHPPLSQQPGCCIPSSPLKAPMTAKALQAVRVRLCV